MAEIQGKMEEEEEATLAELRYLHRTYMERYSLVMEEIRNVVGENNSLGGASVVLGNIENASNHETLIGVGPGIYLKGLIENPDTVMVSVGGGYIVEKGVEDAKKFVEGWIERHNKEANALMKEREELEGAIMDISYRIGKAQEELHV
ncbi:MAG: prefoldin subunit alpha [Candidatus Marsarchaeota archaeon]|jgi:prefoldin alpha subunit|nr:prefoldin subunit alpha [Candidatus Marsarchaeota archaeon]